MLLRDFLGGSTYLAEGAKLGSSAPAKLAFAADDELAVKIRGAMASATTSGQGNELYQRIKRAFFLFHIYGADAFKAPAPNAELRFHEATRDLNTEKAASCLPPGYPQELRSSNLGSYFKLREELAAKITKL